MPEETYVIEINARPPDVPRRIALIHADTSAAVDREVEDTVMTFPHLVVREIIAFEWLLIVLSLISLWFDAPLEGVADPNKTPNPAKAPWYFLGLQELLHYFPPVVAGVLIPILVAIALVVIPYFDINIRREKLWSEHRRSRLLAFATGILALILFLALYQVYIVLVPTLVISSLMVVVYYLQGRAHLPGFCLWLTNQSVAVWIMTWFVIVTVLLTITGTFFRGPGWSFVWPWTN